MKSFIYLSLHTLTPQTVFFVMISTWSSEVFKHYCIIVSIGSCMVWMLTIVCVTCIIDFIFYLFCVHTNQLASFSVDLLSLCRMEFSWADFPRLDSSHLSDTLKQLILVITGTCEGYTWYNMMWLHEFVFFCFNGTGFFKLCLVIWGVWRFLRRLMHQVYVSELLIDFWLCGHVMFV